MGQAWGCEQPSGTSQITSRDVSRRVLECNENSSPMSWLAFESGSHGLMERSYSRGTLPVVDYLETGQYRCYGSSTPYQSAIPLPLIRWQP